MQCSIAYDKFYKKKEIGVIIPLNKLLPQHLKRVLLQENAKWENATKKSNAVELASILGKIKPCEFTHGSCSRFCTPLRGEQQATLI